MPGPLRPAAWLDELIPHHGTALRTLHDADDDRRRDDEHAVDRFKLAGRHFDASVTRTDSGVQSREADGTASGKCYRSENHSNRHSRRRSTLNGCTYLSRSSRTAKEDRSGAGNVWQARNRND